MSQWLSEVIATAQTHQDWLAPHRQAALAELETETPNFSKPPASMKVHKAEKAGV